MLTYSLLKPVVMKETGDDATQCGNEKETLADFECPFPGLNFQEFLHLLFQVQEGVRQRQPLRNPGMRKNFVPTIYICISILYKTQEIYQANALVLCCYST